MAHLPEAIRTAPAVDLASLTPADLRRRDELVALLTQHGGNIAEVARALDKGRMQIHRWVRRYGIALDRFRR